MTLATPYDRYALTVCVFCAFGARHLPDFERRLLLTFVRSIRRVYRNSVKVILLTDKLLDTGLYDDVFSETRGLPVDRSKLLLSRAEAYLSVVNTHDWSTPLALLDYDVLVLQSIGDVFEGDDDVFLTDRAYSKDMPINGGVILLNNKNPKNSSAFYKLVVDIYRSLPSEQLSWWGDQVALSRAVYSGYVSKPNTQVISSSWRARLLPRETHNYTPYDVDSGTKIPPVISDDVIALLRSFVKIAHFKGPRKHLMLEWGRRIGLETD